MGESVLPLAWNWYPTLILQPGLFSTVIFPIFISELEGGVSFSVMPLGADELPSVLFLYHWWNFLISFANCIPYYIICSAITIFFIFITNSPSVGASGFIFSQFKYEFWEKKYETEAIKIAFKAKKRTDTNIPAPHFSLQYLICYFYQPFFSCTSFSLFLGYLIQSSFFYNDLFFIYLIFAFYNTV